jgi:hypothetical protein
MTNRDQVVKFGPETLEMGSEIHRTGLLKWVKIQLIYKMLTSDQLITLFLNNWSHLDFIKYMLFYAVTYLRSGF